MAKGGITSHVISIYVLSWMKAMFVLLVLRYVKQPFTRNVLAIDFVVIILGH